MAITVFATPGKIIHLGRAGENFATTVKFDVSEWLEEFGTGGRFDLFVQQNGIGYYVVQNSLIVQPGSGTGQEENYFQWKINNSITSIVGIGKCELQYIIDEVVVKSLIYDIIVTNSLDVEAAGEVPDPIESWLVEVSQKTQEIEAAALYADTAERYAKGTSNGVEVQENDEDPTGWHDNSKYYKELAESAKTAALAAQTAAANSATTAQQRATAAANSATAAANSATAAAGSATASANSATTAAGSATAAANSATTAQQQATAAAGSVTTAQQWATGGTSGTPSATNNAKYYAERIQSLSAGTVTTGAPGSQAAANVVLDSQNNSLTLNMTIPQGPQGLQGPQGERGLQGYGLQIVGTVTSSSGLPSASSVSPGTAYGVGPNPPYTIYISDGTSWVNYGMIGGITAEMHTWTA